jgi:hypothetical protein
MATVRAAPPPIEVTAGRGRPLGMSAAAFLRGYWQKRPLLIRRAFAGVAAPLAPRDLFAVAGEADALARLVQRRGKRYTVRHGPFRASEFERMPGRDWTLLVQDCDKWFDSGPRPASPFRVHTALAHRRRDGELRRGRRLGRRARGPVRRVPAAGHGPAPLAHQRRSGAPRPISSRTDRSSCCAGSRPRTNGCSSRRHACTCRRGSRTTASPRVRASRARSECARPLPRNCSPRSRPRWSPTRHAATPIRTCTRRARPESSSGAPRSASGACSSGWCGGDGKDDWLARFLTQYRSSHSPGAAATEGRSPPSSAGGSRLVPDSNCRPGRARCSGARGAGPRSTSPATRIARASRCARRLTSREPLTRASAKGLDAGDWATLVALANDGHAEVTT